MKMVGRRNAVDVVKCRQGLEDGFECMSYHDKCSEAESNCFRDCYMCRQQDYVLRQPYILTEQGKQYIHAGDYIVTDKSGRKSVMAPDLVGSMYEDMAVAQ